MSLIMFHSPVRVVQSRSRGNTKRELSSNNIKAKGGGGSSRREHSLLNTSTVCYARSFQPGKHQHGINVLTLD